MSVGPAVKSLRILGKVAALAPNKAKHFWKSDVMDEIIRAVFALTQAAKVYISQVNGQIFSDERLLPHC